MIPDSGEVYFVGRTNDLALGWGSLPYAGYALHFRVNGVSELKIENGKSLASGILKKFEKKWHSVEMVFNGESIEVVIDKKMKTKVADSTYNHGIVAIGTGWNEAYFDNIKVSELK